MLSLCWARISAAKARAEQRLRANPPWREEEYEDFGDAPLTANSRDWQHTALPSLAPPARWGAGANAPPPPPGSSNRTLLAL